MKYLTSSIDNYSNNEINDFLESIYYQKKEKIKKIKQATRFKQSIVGEILLKKLLETYNIDYLNSNFETNAWGKSYIKESGIFFNMSHSYDYVICAISKKEIGIDIEKIREANIKNAKIFATENEQKYISTINGKNNTRLFEIYTLKEAYYKTLNCSLAKVKNVEFSIDGEKIHCSDKNVRCKLIRDIPGYIIAICETKNYTNV